MVNHNPLPNPPSPAPCTFSSACAANEASNPLLDNDRIGNLIEYLLTTPQHHPFMPLIATDSLHSLHTSPHHSEQPQICVDSLRTRADRTRVSLQNSKALATILATSRPLADALQPFLKPRSTNACDAVSFLYSFGVVGPTQDQWHSLFFASLASRLRVEDLVVLAACTACGVTDLAQEALPAIVSDVVFGLEPLPSVLEKVCDLYDEWLLSEHFFERLLELHITSITESWSINVHNDGCTVCVNEREWNIPNELSPTTVTDICAKIVVASVVPNVVQQISLMISYGGSQRVYELLQCSLVQFLYAAVVHSKSILYERILSAFER
ncbi:unnamed protein product [Agarophyton chilense]